MNRVENKQVPESNTYAAGELVRSKVHFSGSQPITAIVTLNKTELTSANNNIRIVEFENYIMVSIMELSPQEAGR